MRYWVVRRSSADAGPGGYYRSMHIYAGPFASSGEAWQEQREAVNQLSREERIIYHVNYMVMSDTQIAEGQRQGIRFTGYR
jgi:hypothetical protein